MDYEAAVQEWRQQGRDVALRVFKMAAERFP